MERFLRDKKFFLCYLFVFVSTSFLVVVIVVFFPLRLFFLLLLSFLLFCLDSFANIGLF